MGYSHERIKNNAKSFYSNNKTNSIVAQLIYIGITMAASIVSVIIINILILISGAVISLSDNFLVSSVFVLVSVLIISLMYLAIIAVTYILFMGVQNWYRSSIYVQTPLSEIFSVFKKERFRGSAGVVTLVILYTTLWGMLFIIPGIIKFYSYSQAMFIKAENPEIPASRAIELSKAMMNGHKADLLYLQISFLGWFILSALTYNILGIIYVFPYYFSAMAFAYEEIKSEADMRGTIDISEISGQSYIQ